MISMDQAEIEKVSEMSAGVEAVVETLDQALYYQLISEELLLDLCQGLIRLEKLIDSDPNENKLTTSKISFSVAQRFRRALLRKMGEEPGKWMDDEDDGTENAF